MGKSEISIASIIINTFLELTDLGIKEVSLFRLEQIKELTIKDLKENSDLIVKCNYSVNEILFFIKKHQGIFNTSNLNNDIKKICLKNDVSEEEIIKNFKKYTLYYGLHSSLSIEYKKELYSLFRQDYITENERREKNIPLDEEVYVKENRFNSYSYKSHERRRKRREWIG